MCLAADVDGTGDRAKASHDEPTNRQTDELTEIKFFSRGWQTELTQKPLSLKLPSKRATVTAACACE